MGNYIGGDTFSAKVAHPTIGVVTFQCKAAEDDNMDFGGNRVADEDNAVTGSGVMIATMNRKRWKRNVVIAADMNEDLDVEKANQIAGSTLESSITFTHISGAIHKGKGRIVGEIALNTNKATCPLTFSGGGILEKL